jgi:hypothetical protein
VSARYSVEELPEKQFMCLQGYDCQTSVPNVSLDQGFVETAIREKNSLAPSTDQIRCWATASMSASELVSLSSFEGSKFTVTWQAPADHSPAKAIEMRRQLPGLVSFPSPGKRKRN